MKIVTVNQMQQAERDSSRYGISLSMLMENAGKAFAEEVRRILGDTRDQNVLILVGPGNNGGDGLVAARYFFDWGAAGVHVYLCGKRSTDDSNLEEVKKRNIPCCAMEQDLDLKIYNQWLSNSTVVLDAVFGTGKIRPLSGNYSLILKRLQEVKNLRRNLKLISLDLPSGLDADTGLVDPATPAFDCTITLGFPKVGIFNLPGMEKIGKLSVVDIGIPAQLVEELSTELMEKGMIRDLLPVRQLTSHKGTFGKILALVGSTQYTGAAFLACTGTLRAGAGLTTLAISQSLFPVLAAKLTEVTFQPLPESSQGISVSESVEIIRSLLPRYDVFITGCGIGQSQPVVDLLVALLLDPHEILPPAVIDADALNILARNPGWDKLLKSEAVLTPHAGEMSRLLDQPVEEIQSNRIEITREAARRWKKVVVLKGAYTVIASPEGQVRVSPFANAGLASAGTGDVLAGTIAGMLAQGLSPFDAASCGVFLHGLAGELVNTEMGDAGMLAGDLLPALPRAIRQLKQV